MKGIKIVYINVSIERLCVCVLVCLGISVSSGQTKKIIEVSDITQWPSGVSNLEVSENTDCFIYGIQVEKGSNTLVIGDLKKNRTDSVIQNIRSDMMIFIDHGSHVFDYSPKHRIYNL